MVRRGRSGVESPARLDHAAIAQFHQSQRPERQQSVELGPHVHRQVRHSGQLRGVPGLGRLEPGQTHPAHVVSVHRVSERRLGVPQPALRVDRGDQRSRGLQSGWRAGHREQSPGTRHSDFRHRRHRAPEAAGHRADLPRFAHAQRRDGLPRRQERVCVHLRVGTGAVAERVAGMFRPLSRHGPEQRALPDRGHPGAAGSSGAGPRREQARHPRGVGRARASRRLAG